MGWPNSSLINEQASQLHRKNGFREKTVSKPTSSSFDGSKTSAGRKGGAQTDNWLGALGHWVTHDFILEYKGLVVVTAINWSTKWFPIPMLEPALHAVYCHTVGTLSLARWRFHFWIKTSWHVLHSDTIIHFHIHIYLVMLKGWQMRMLSLLFSDLVMQKPCSFAQVKILSF